jgi:hypothetical protein
MSIPSFIEKQLHKLFEKEKEKYIYEMVENEFKKIYENVYCECKIW